MTTPEITFTPIHVGSSGKERRVGIEIEFAGVGINPTVELIQSIFGGQPKVHNPYKTEIENTSVGKFSVELDSTLLKDKRYKDTFDTFGIDLSEKSASTVENFLETILSTLVPFEIVAPPIPISELGKIDLMCQGLRQLGALGTKASILNAFGAHLNIEIARSDVNYFLSHIRAFMLLCPQLRQSHNVNISRKVAGFIKDYPEEYVEKVLDSNYFPDLDTLVTDYLRYNPTRNRALDMTTIFALTHLEQVKSAVAEPNLLNARPAFHYRLPNCEIDEANWSIIHEWNRWASVEILAAEQEKLAEQSALFSNAKQNSEEIFSEEKIRLGNI